MKFPIVLGLAAISALGCTAQTEKTPAQIAAAWYRPTSTDPKLEARGVGSLRQLDRSEFSRVTQSQWPKVQPLLEKSALLPISRAQAVTFTGKNFGALASRTPFLVRAVFYPADEGEWTVFHQKAQLATLHFAMGPRKQPMKPDALVVFLPTRPTDIFVDCSFIKTG